MTQPKPTPRTTTPIHDLVIIDLIGTCLSGNELLMKELNDRKAIGLAEYGTHLQAFNGRDCETDAIEEMVDSICYLKQGIMEGKDYLEPIYHRAIALAVDTINLRAIHADDILDESTNKYSFSESDIAEHESEGREMHF